MQVVYSSLCLIMYEYTCTEEKEFVLCNKTEETNKHNKFFTKIVSLLFILPKHRCQNHEDNIFYLTVKENHAILLNLNPIYRRCIQIYQMFFFCVLFTGIDCMLRKCDNKSFLVVFVRVFFSV